jgi:hypothetical protein
MNARDLGPVQLFEKCVAGRSQLMAINGFCAGRALLVLFGQAALVFCDQVPRLAMLSFAVKFPLRACSEIAMRWISVTMRRIVFCFIFVFGFIAKSPA